MCLQAPLVKTGSPGRRKDFALRLSDLEQRAASAGVNEGGVGGQERETGDEAAAADIVCHQTPRYF